MSKRGRKPSAEDPVAKQVRCAIYTRVSTSSGLGMEFTSLDAQREAAENYIASQKEKGWVCLPDRYDDGGYTGANTNRAAMQRLLADIRTGKIDVVVVYRMDRLSRSLFDFARIVEVFEQHGVQFVSLSEYFDTTTPMGRMHLGILLTFAQYERDVAGGAKPRVDGEERRFSRSTG